MSNAAMWTNTKWRYAHATNFPIARLCNPGRPTETRHVAALKMFKKGHCIWHQQARFALMLGAYLVSRAKQHMNKTVTHCPRPQCHSAGRSNTISSGCTVFRFRFLALVLSCHSLFLCRYIARYSCTRTGSPSSVNHFRFVLWTT